MALKNKLLHTKKGILLTLVTIVLLILMIGELMLYTILNIEFNTLAVQSSISSTTKAFSISVESAMPGYLENSLRNAIYALATYEETPSLRHWHFINNTGYAIESLMYNGTIYGTNMSNYMNGTIASYENSVNEEAAIEGFSSSFTNTSIFVFQRGPFNISATYTGLLTTNSVFGIFTYPINVTITIPLNGTPDLYSAEAASPEIIKAARKLPSALLIGGMHASSANTMSTAFVYGTIVLNNGPTCSSVPSQFQNPYFILAMPNANDINSNLCNMGGLVTSTLNSTPPAKPYLVYPQSIFNYITNGTKVLLQGSSKSLLSIAPIKEAMQEGYYYPSPYAPSYMDWANSTFERSQYGIVSFNILHKEVANLNANGATAPRTFI
ncbi:MAG: hypothetical protein ACP5FR_01070, partial [Candidatus Micrarchaeia archaeon]